MKKAIKITYQMDSLLGGFQMDNLKAKDSLQKENQLVHGHFIMIEAN